MKVIILFLLIPSLMMAGLGFYWINMVRALDATRAEFLEKSVVRSHQQSIDGLISGQTQVDPEKYRDALKREHAMVDWERGYYDILRRNMINLGWIAWFIAFCQVAAVYWIHKRLKGARIS